MPGSDRKNFAIQVLAGSETVSDLAVPHEVSRKFVYQQTRNVRATLNAGNRPEATLKVGDARQPHRLRAAL